MARLHVVSSYDDVELDAIRRAIGMYVSVAGLDEVITALRVRGERGDCIESLDMIGHSRSDGFLVLGDWVIDDSPQTSATFSELLRPRLKQLGVETIRVLGCSTAVTERGRNAIRRIARVTGCKVLGTKRYISRYDYGAAGFASDDTLVALSLDHATKA